MAGCIVMDPDDNVAVALETLAGKVDIAHHGAVTLVSPVPTGHKFALRAIPSGSPVVKYGSPIGTATIDIAPGEWVHVHNLRTTLSGEREYVFTPAPSPTPQAAAYTGPAPSFRGYRRSNGTVGVRNEVWILPTVGCVNHLASRLAAMADAEKPTGVDAVVALTHPYGCSQMGDDHERTRHILANLANHPNAAAVLVLGLGCENNTIESFRELLEANGGERENAFYLKAQDEEDEMASAMRILRNAMSLAGAASRDDLPVSELCVGLKCGGSDGLSGITANPLLGAFSDWLIDRGGKTILTEVPEMFGAEESLLNRAMDEDVFRRGVAMINDFKRYFLDHGQAVYENPSPGNKDGGISTLEDKSLGCTRKGGTRAVVDVLPYGGVARRPGLTLLSGPGNDIVAATALAAAGAQIVLFTTGRGTPLGSPVPVVKVSTNSPLAARKRNWIDFDAGPIALGAAIGDLLPGFIETVLAAAGGRHTRSEENGCRDFAIFKGGVTV